MPATRSTRSQAAAAAKMSEAVVDATTTGDASAGAEQAKVGELVPRDPAEVLCVVLFAISSTKCTALVVASVLSHHIPTHFPGPKLRQQHKQLDSEQSLRLASLSFG